MAQPWAQRRHGVHIRTFVPAWIAARFKNFSGFGVAGPRYRLFHILKAEFAISKMP
jgi:hypothetical protein